MIVIVLMAVTLWATVWAVVTHLTDNAWAFFIYWAILWAVVLPLAKSVKRKGRK